MALKLECMNAAQFSRFWDEYEATVVELMKLAEE
jgi:hypothetical protein